MAAGRIFARDNDKGSGFTLTSRAVVTAGHVVRDQEVSALRFVLGNGRSVQVVRVERDETLDIAVLHLSEVVPDVLEVGPAVEGASWRVEAQPRGNDPLLTGTINATHRRLVNAKGHEIQALQLLVDQQLGDYKGYSGSAVALRSPRDAVIVGVLIEQLRWRIAASPGQSRPVSNVLYAIPIEDVVKRFKLDAVWSAPVSKFRLPRPPGHLVSREDELRPAKNDLLGDASKMIEGGRRIALVGMGGTGKTVLAIQLARDQDVQQAFPDGVVWLELDGERLVDYQVRLAAKLGDIGQTFHDPDQGLDHLSRLLAERKCLLVLDNVRRRCDLDAFDVLGPRGRLLFTTRDEDLANSYGASVHNVGLLSAEQARGLLASSAGLDVNALPTEADGVLTECGGLPLAIAMAGAMVRRRRHRWPSLLRKLRKADVNQIAARLPGYPHPNLLVALDVSVEDLDVIGRDRSLESAQDRYVDLAVFAGQGAVPEEALTALWAKAHIGADEVGDYAQLFVDRSLATWDAEGRLGLHDLQMD